MLAEISLGRASQSDVVGSFSHFAKYRTAIPKFFAGYGLGLATMLICHDSIALGIVIALLSILVWRFGWRAAGFSAVGIALLILSYYAMIGGWFGVYIWKAFSGQLDFVNSQVAASTFMSVASSGTLTSCMTIFFPVSRCRGLLVRCQSGGGEGFQTFDAASVCSAGCPRCARADSGWGICRGEILFGSGLQQIDHAWFAGSHGTLFLYLESGDGDRCNIRQLSAAQPQHFLVRCTGLYSGYLYGFACRVGDFSGGFFSRDEPRGRSRASF